MHVTNRPMVSQPTRYLLLLTVGLSGCLLASCTKPDAPLPIVQPTAPPAIPTVREAMTAAIRASAGHGVFSSKFAYQCRIAGSRRPDGTVLVLFSRSLGSRPSGKERFKDIFQVAFTRAGPRSKELISQNDLWAGRPFDPQDPDTRLCYLIANAHNNWSKSMATWDVIDVVIPPEEQKEDQFYVSFRSIEPEYSFIHYGVQIKANKTDASGKPIWFDPNLGDPSAP